MSGSIRIERCSNHHTDAVQRFLGEHWRAGHILSHDRNLLFWQHSPPRASELGFDGPSILLALEHDQIVGMLGLIPVGFNLRGRLLRGCWLAIWHVIEQARSTSAGLELLGMLHDLAPEAIGVLGINDRVARIYRGLRYQVMDDLPRWIGIFNIESTSNLIGHCSPGDLQAFRIVLNQDADDFHGILVERMEHRFTAKWDEFWNRQLAPRLIGTNRDAAYMNWRYAEHPTFRYERLSARDERGCLCGTAVYRIETVAGSSVRVMRIVEFLANERAGLALARRIASDAQEFGVAFADFYCAAPQFAVSLEAVGFRRCGVEPTGPIFPCRFQPLEQSRFAMSGAFRITCEHSTLSDSLLTADDLYVTKSDGDMDRPN
ncbi:MAG: hypothetical protein KF841_02485 [Phycisphaerae bacterium]|nr:hypothetical protein [Phycisphaerae bacterium]